MDPLRIVVGHGEILRARLLRVTRQVNQFAVQREESSQGDAARLEFDYLDAGDGAVIEVLHTGPRALAKIEGTIKGIPKGVELVQKNSYQLGAGLAILLTRQRFIQIMMGLVIAGALAMILAGVFYESLPQWVLSPTGLDPAPPRLFVLGFGLLYLGFGFVALWLRRDPVPSALRPGVEE